MSWIKSASTFLDQIDQGASDAAKDGAVAKAADGVLGRAKMELVKTLAAVGTPHAPLLCFSPDGARALRRGRGHLHRVGRGGRRRRCRGEEGR